MQKMLGGGQSSPLQVGLEPIETMGLSIVKKPW